jgi:uncharacterized protein (DUF885 family)
MDSVATEFIRGYLGARPLLASALGFHDHDGRINEFTRLAIDAELSRLNRFDERLKRFDILKLEPSAAIDLRLLQAVVARELFLMHDLAVYDHDPMIYAGAIDVNVYAKRRYAPIDDRVRSIVAVENQAANVVIAAKTNLVDALPKPYVELAIQIARGSADFLRRNLADLLTDLKDDNLRGALSQASRRAAIALTDYAAWLEKERLPRASPEFAIGQEKYQRFLSQTELVDLSLDKLLEIGRAELKREQEAFSEAGKKINASQSAQEVFKQIQSEHASAENLVAEMSRKMDSARKYVVDNKLVAIPTEIRPQVRDTPQYLRPTTFAFLDSPGSFEKRSMDAFFYVSPPENNWTDQQKNEWLTAFNSSSAELIAIRETYPGRYVQALHLNSSKAGKLEKLFGVTSFIEGWAHYCQKMMIDAGYGSKFGPEQTDEEVRQAAKYRMAQAQQGSILFARLCVSINMHTRDMSLDEATRFFQDNCYYEETPARLEALRATFDFGYVTDALGTLEIRKLRDDYEIQEGENFSLRKFHDELLNHGMLPIRLLREVMLKEQTKWEDVL